MMVLTSLNQLQDLLMYCRTSRSSPQISSSPKLSNLIQKPKGEPGTSQGYAYKDVVRVPKVHYNLWKVCGLLHILIYGNMT